MTVDTKPVTSHVDGDHERFSHIVSKDEQMRGYVFGDEIQALCGLRLVPSRPPELFPVCPECTKQAKMIGPYH